MSKTSDMEKSWPDLAGRIGGDSHVLPVRVYFEDTDFAGLVYHANYLKFCERGRTDFIRLLGIHHQALANPEEGEPAVFVVRRVEIDYLKPARLDDVLEVFTWCGEIGGASLTLSQEVRRGETVIVKAKVVVVLISGAGKPQRIGTMIREALQRFVNHPLPSWIANDAGGPGSVTKPKFSHIRSRKVGPV
jgi:acyl-CoA thioester hydrolase